MVVIQGISGCFGYYSRYVRLSWLLFKVCKAVLVIIQGISGCIGYYSRYVRVPWLLFRVYHAAVFNDEGITPRCLGYYSGHNGMFGYYSRFTHMTDTVKGKIIAVRKEVGLLPAEDVWLSGTAAPRILNLGTRYMCGKFCVTSAGNHWIGSSMRPEQMRTQRFRYLRITHMKRTTLSNNGVVSACQHIYLPGCTDEL